ncbi:MAG: hypothetical protein ABSD20_12150 [Terriglobales bacterium]
MLVAIIACTRNDAVLDAFAKDFMGCVELQSITETEPTVFPAADAMHNPQPEWARISPLSEDGHVPIKCHRESSWQQRKAGSSLARRRYQKGSLILRGKREKVWVGRWLEDEIQPDGSIERIHKSEVLGSLKDFPTKRLAQRELDARVSVINSPTYRARPTATFKELAEKWKTLVMVNHEDSTQRSEKSDIKAWSAAIGDVQIRNIDCERLQNVISSWTCSPKTVKNRVGTFRLIWDKAKSWKYTAETAYDGLDMPQWVKGDQPCFTVGQVQQIIKKSQEPYRTIRRLG